MATILFIINLILFPSWVTLYSDKEEILLKSSSYWKLSLALLTDSELQEKLKVTKEQRTRIDLMRGGDLEAVVTKSLFSTKAENLPKGVSRDDIAFSLCNPEVRKGLTEILSKEQMSNLQRVWLGVRFKEGFAPFEDDEVLGLCGLSYKEFADQVNKSKSVYEKELGKLNSNVTMALVDALPSEYRVLFVGLVGNKYLPLSPNFIPDGIDAHPYRGQGIGLGTAERLQLGQYVTDLLITKEQSKKLAEIGRTSKEMIQRRDIHKSIRQYCEAEIKKILSNVQLDLIARHRALELLEDNPTKFFADRELQKYFGFDNESAKWMKAIAGQEKEKLDSKVAELNRRTFEVLCSTIPESESAKLKILFKDAW